MIRRIAIGEVAGVVAVDEEAADLVGDGRPQATDGRGHDRRAACLGLDGDQPEGLRVRRHDRDVGGAVPLDQDGAIGGRLEAHEVVDAEAAGQVHEGGRLVQPAARGAAADHDHEPLAQRSDRRRRARRRRG